MNHKPLYKASSRKSLAFAYGVSYHTIRVWLKPIENNVGKPIGTQYNPKQVEKIVELLGEPEHIELIRA